MSGFQGQLLSYLDWNSRQSSERDLGSANRFSNATTDYVASERSPYPFLYSLSGHLNLKKAQEQSPLGMRTADYCMSSPGASFRRESDGVTTQDFSCLFHIRM